MTALPAVHTGLSKVRRLRALVRLGSGWAVFVTGLLGTLAAAFVLDFGFHRLGYPMGRLERGIVLLATVAAGVWAFRRFVLPALRVREDDLALALMVEKRQGIGSDLVAAMQFADAGRPQFGSTDLRQAVVNYIDEAARSFNFLEGFSRKELQQRLGLLAVTLALTVLPAMVFQGHARAFASRFLLGSAHYPTRTVIEHVSSPGRRAAYGRPVVFRVEVRQTRGEPPPQGSVRLKALTSGLSTVIDLQRQPQSDEQKRQEGVLLYAGQLARALDDLTYSITIGDAYTEPKQVKLIPLPLVKVDLEVTVPPYAAERLQAEAQGQRQRVVLEGANVVPVVTADKKLKSATMVISGARHALRQDGERFVLDDATSPLAAVADTLRYELQVVDDDGLGLEAPIVGLIQVRPDQPPRIGAAAISRFVLPTAEPTIKFLALDDYGLSRIVLHRTVIRGDGKEEQTSLPLVEPADHPAQFGRTITLALAELQLNVGDRVSVTLEAADWRGALPAKSTRSETITFQVTDRAGVIAALRELDEQIDRKLDDIIKAQLGLGG